MFDKTFNTVSDDRRATRQVTFSFQQVSESVNQWSEPYT